jgi:hypothetical protein
VEDAVVVEVTLDGLRRLEVFDVFELVLAAERAETLLLL